MCQAKRCIRYKNQYYKPNTMLFKFVLLQVLQTIAETKLVIQRNHINNISNPI